VGSVDVVVPQNIAAAVNYACVECVTVALATQLVVSLDGPLDEAGQRELAEIWAELQDLAEAVPTLSLADLRDRLDEYEARIVAVVRANGESTTTEESSDADASGSEAPGATEEPDALEEEPAGGAGTSESSPAESTSGATPSTSTSAPATSAPATAAEPTPPAGSEAAAASSAVG